MRTLNVVFQTEITKKENKPILLYTIEDYDGSSNNLNFAQYDADVVFDGVTYSKFPVKHNSVSENIKGVVDTLSITLGNANRVIQAYLEAYNGLKRKKVLIKTVFANQLSSSDAYIEDVFYISSVESNSTSVTFNLTSRLDIMDATIPRSIYYRDHCRWLRFKGTECGYAGAETTCNRTKAQCKAYGNYLRFGGFPSIPQSKIYIM